MSCCAACVACNKLPASSDFLGAAGACCARRACAPENCCPPPTAPLVHASELRGGGCLQLSPLSCDQAIARRQDVDSERRSRARAKPVALAARSCACLTHCGGASALRGRRRALLAAPTSPDRLPHDSPRHARECSPCRAATPTARSPAHHHCNLAVAACNSRHSQLVAALRGACSSCGSACRAPRARRGAPTTASRTAVRRAAAALPGGDHHMRAAAQRTGVSGHGHGQDADRSGGAACSQQRAEGGRQGGHWQAPQKQPPPPPPP